MKFLNNNIFLCLNTNLDLEVAPQLTRYWLITYEDISSYIDQGLVVDLIFFDYIKHFIK